MAAELLTAPRLVGALTLFATHFHELAGLARDAAASVGVGSPDAFARVLDAPRLPAVNAHMAVHAPPAPSGIGRETAGASALTLMYEVRPGPSYASFGLSVAAAAGFPEAVIADAEAVLLLLEARRRGELRVSS